MASGGVIFELDDLDLADPVVMNFRSNPFTSKEEIKEMVSLWNLSPVDVSDSIRRNRLFNTNESHFDEKKYGACKVASVLRNHNVRSHKGKREIIPDLVSSHSYCIIGRFSGMQVHKDKFENVEQICLDVGLILFRTFCAVSLTVQPEIFACSLKNEYIDLNCVLAFSVHPLQHLS